MKKIMAMEILIMKMVSGLRVYAWKYESNSLGDGTVSKEDLYSAPSLTLRGSSEHFTCSNTSNIETQTYMHIHPHPHACTHTHTHTWTTDIKTIIKTGRGGV